MSNNLTKNCSFAIHTLMATGRNPIRLWQRPQLPQAGPRCWIEKHPQCVAFQHSTGPYLPFPTKSVTHLVSLTSFQLSNPVMIPSYGGVEPAIICHPCYPCPCIKAQEPTGSSHPRTPGSSGRSMNSNQPLESLGYLCDKKKLLWHGMAQGWLLSKNGMPFNIRSGFRMILSGLGSCRTSFTPQHARFCFCGRRSFEGCWSHGTTYPAKGSGALCDLALGDLHRSWKHIFIISLKVQ